MMEEVKDILDDFFQIDLENELPPPPSTEMVIIISNLSSQMKCFKSIISSKY